MKKTIILTTLILALTALAGCMGMDNMDSARNGMQNAADDIKDKVQQTADDITQSAEQTVDKSQFIGEEQAKQKALERAGLTQDGIIFEKTDLDFDDGVWEYEVDFRHAGYEYDVNVNAKTGEIIKFDKETDD